MTVFYVQCNNGLKWVQFPEEMGAMKTLDFENDKTSFFYFKWALWPKLQVITVSLLLELKKQEVAQINCKDTRNTLIDVVVVPVFLPLKHIQYKI